MLNNKSDFILEYIESRDKSLKKENVDWSQSRVIFVSPLLQNTKRIVLTLKMFLLNFGKFKNFLMEH